MKRILVLTALLAALFSGVALAQDYVPTPVTVSQEKVRLNGKVYLSHVVLERQTLYGISQAYGVSVEDIYEANPTLRDTGLQKNAIILIPYREASADELPYIEHRVRWYEDLNDIARRYGVGMQEIMDLNGMTSPDITARQILKIPRQAGTVTAPAEPPAPVAEEPAPVEPETAPEVPGTDIPAVDEDAKPEEAEPGFFTYTGKNSVEMSLVLPLGASGNMVGTNMDFYSGVLMALREIERNGINVKLNVFDLNAGMPAIEVLCHSDFVLGPVTPRDIEAVLQRVGGQVPVISPLDQRAGALGANYSPFIQTPSPADTQYQELCEWLFSETGQNDNIILITEKNAVNSTAAVAARSMLSRLGVNYDILSYAVVEGRGVPATLNERMTRGGVNRVLVASESEAFIGDVMRNLGIMLSRGFELVMYAPSKVRTFDTIDGSTYHQASLHICANYFADYNSSAVRDFVFAYRALFNTEPSQFAFQGYDTAMFFVTRCAKYGNAWLRMLGAERVSGLHTDFQFVEDGDGTVSNRAVRRITFNRDYSTTISR